MAVLLAFYYQQRTIIFFWCPAETLRKEFFSLVVAGQAPLNAQAFTVTQ